MKKIYLLQILLIILINVSFGQKIIILHTNDMHSKITGFGPENQYTPLTLNDDATVGGFARLATLISQEKAANGDKVLVCDAGDFLMGSVFQVLEPSTGFQLRLMKKMGYDFVTLGNHEFDYGPYVLANIIAAAKKNGEIPQILASQMEFPINKFIKDHTFLDLFADNTIKVYSVIEKNGLKIGIFGIIGKDAIHVAPNASPISFSDPVKTAKRITKILKDVEKVDIVICLSHSGFYPNDKGEMEGEDLDLARKVPDIDVIISGHTHVATPNYIEVGNTTIVQTGCYVHNLGRIELNYDNGKISIINFKLIPVDDKIKGDENIIKLINEQEKKVDDLVFKPFGLSYLTPVAEADFDIKRGDFKTKEPGVMGNFVADAIYYYTNKFSTGTDIAMINEGLIRENILKGDICPADVFRIMPLGKGATDFLGYPLAQIYITGFELKKLLELALISGVPGEDSYLYFSGVKAYYNPKKPFIHKVEEVFVDGKKINTSKKDETLYRLTANVYLLSFIGEVKKISHGLIKIFPKDVNGNRISIDDKCLLDFDADKTGLQEGKEWLAIIELIKTFSDIDNNGLKDIPDSYKTYKKVFTDVNDLDVVPVDN